MMDWSLTLQIAVSIVTLVAVWYNGRKNVWGPRFGVVANVVWWALCIHDQLWGLIPFQLAMTYLSWRMLILWELDHRRGG